VGRRARLELVFGWRGGRTVLEHAYAEPPYRLVRPFSQGTGLHVIVASSAPGVFAGDSFTQEIVLEPGARVHLTSQSAMQVHPSLDDRPAHLRCRYSVGEAAQLTCFWDPLIPFAGSQLDQRLSITLAERSRLLWSDAFMNGREGSGERWAFASLFHELKVVRQDSMEYLERYRLEPGASPGVSMVAGAASYFGTVVSSGWNLELDRAARIHADLAGLDTVRGAADRLGDRLLIVRLMARSGAAFREARALLAAGLCAGPDA
jgi:urease accessory protein